MTDIVSLGVLLYDEPVGTITRLEADRTVFTFNEQYVGNPNRATLSLGFKDSVGELMTDFRVFNMQLMPFFSNLLPEGRMREYLADRAGVRAVREFQLLSALGADLPGAITVQPSRGQRWPREDEHDHHDVQTAGEGAMRFSLAGVQLKFSAIVEARSGLTIPATGSGGSWIIKLPSAAYEGVPENEYSMMTLARMLSVDVPAIELVDVDDIGNLPPGISNVSGKALAIERFDRLDDGSRVHIEDFAQVFGVYPRDKYDNASARAIGRVLVAETSSEDIAEFMRRLTFNSLIGNGDMHLKNWSLIYSDKRTAALAPAYDFVSTIPYMDDQSAALRFSRTKRFDEFTEDELIHLAAKAGMPETIAMDAARETVELFRQHWSREKTNLPLSKEVVSAIEAHLKRVPFASV